ncbi:MAG: hypothetical protein EBQ85_06630 [Proteobacteria bacterium]|nr:hypothetical protein [Pseudomonadota bacterium]
MRLVCFLFLLVAPFVWGDEQVINKKWFAEMEAGSVWQSRNDVRIPSDTGTAFSLNDFGTGPVLAGRVYFGYRWSERSEFRVLFAPLVIKGLVSPSSAITFQDQTFNASLPTFSYYRFNSYRLTYRYRFWDDEKWKGWIGFTAKVRDARIALQQGTVEAEKSDIGFVPLLNFKITYQVSSGWWIDLDGDALAAPQGRAEDVVLRGVYQYSPDIKVNAGYRILEGGADNKKVFTFTCLHYLVAGLEVSF